MSLRGFSMVELMVAMLIGLIGMIIIFQVFEVSEGIKRTTTSGGDAQQNGAVALYLIERDLRNAGLGFNDTPTAGCQIIGYDSKRQAPNFNFPTAPDTLLLVPARIISFGATTEPDQLTIFYGSKPNVVNSTFVQPPGMPNPTDPLNLINPYGYNPGDLVVIQDSGAPTPCSIMEVTAASTSPPNVLHSTSGYPLISGGFKIPRFNPAGGLPATYTGALGPTRIFNLGNIHEPAGSPDLPVHNTYAIVNRSLQLTSLFVPNSAPASPLVNTVADNIVHMRALYGIDEGPYNPAPGGGPNLGDGDGIIDRYVDAATFNALVLNGVTPPWRYILAVRVAVVARSALAEKPSEGASGCDATTDGSETPPGADRRPRWTGPGPVLPPAAQVPFNLTADPDWKCYRYRVFETTVPMRNWIWRSN